MLGKEFAADIQHIRAAAAITLLLLIGAAARPAQAQGGTYTLLHTFTNSPDGGNPSPLIGDAQGNLYGTTRGGGPACIDTNITCGTVFKVDGTGNETVIYTFQGSADGAFPIAGVIRDADGNLYGNTEGNGVIGAVSTIFKVDPSGNETVLHDFNGPEGCCQDSRLALDAKGNIYGTSPYSGDYNCDVIIGLGCGSIYRLTPSGKIKDIHIFTGTDGIKPEGGVVLDGKGNLYGTTLLGGNLECFSPAGVIQEAQGCGTVFELDSSGAVTVLHTFTGQADGSSPLGLIRDPDGNLYGIASYGGDLACYPPDGCGTIFEVDANGNFSVLAIVTPSLTPEPLFASHLFRDPEGNLYGAAQIGGANFSGFIFKVRPGETLTNIFSFPSTAQEQDGSIPQSITMDSAGNFYGSMLIRGFQDNDCGFQGCGTVFKVTF